MSEDEQKIESVILCGLIFNRHLIDECPLRSFDNPFYTGVNSLIFKALIALDSTTEKTSGISKGRLRTYTIGMFKDISQDTLKQCLSDIYKYEYRVVDGDISIELEKQVDLCIKKGALDAINRAQYLIGDGGSGKASLEVLSGAVKNISDRIIQQEREKSNADEVKDMIGLTVDMAEGNIKPFVLGISRVDRHMMLTETDYLMIGARPSVGKSAFGLTVLCNNIGRRRGLFISLEMPKSEILLRMGQILYNTPIADLRKKIVDGKATQADYQDYVEALDKVAKNPNIHISCPVNRGVSHIINLIRKKKREEGIEFVVIDYIQLMRNDSGVKDHSREQELANISSALRQLSKNEKVLVVPLAQLRRTDKAIPTLQEFRESGSLEQDATHAILLTREPNNDYTDNVKYILGKNRNGPTAIEDGIYVKALAKFGVIDTGGYE